MIVIAIVGILSVLLLLFVVLFPKRTFSYQDKHVVITGGSQGIGLEAARLYLALGAKVTLVARNKQKLQQAEASLDKKDSVRCVSIDVSRPSTEISNALASSREAFGPVCVLVNCAGISLAAEFAQLKDDDFSQLMTVNYLGSVHPTKAVLEDLKENSGRLVFVSSQVAQVAIHGYSAYAASKWAVRGLAEALQMELKPFGVMVSVCYPPDTDTPGYELEMQSKPDITKLLSEAGNVFTPQDVAREMIEGSTAGLFGISIGLDGYLLKQLHPGMTPVNCAVEVLAQIALSGLARVVSVFYLLQWDYLVRSHHRSVKKSD